MIKSSKHHIKESNKAKKEALTSLIPDYKELLSFHINHILKTKNFMMLPKPPTNDKITHSRWIQCCYKQAIEIVKSNIKLTSNQVYKKYKRVYHKCLKKNKFKKFTDKKFSELNINIWKRINIDLKDTTIILDQRLVDFKQGKHFDEFIRIRLPYFHPSKKQGLIVKVPLKQHKQSLKFKNEWNRKQSIGLSIINKNQLTVTLFYEKEQKEKVKYDKSVGIDMGYKKLINTSTGKFYGKELVSVYERLSKKKRGSKNYKDLLQHKKCLINQFTNQFYLEHKDYNIIIEDLKNIKQNKKGKFVNKLQYWSATQVANKLDLLSKEEGFLLKLVEPAYTSQECSQCGHIDKSSRDREVYKCVNCNMILDADFNASINILHRGVYSSSNTKKFKQIEF